MCAKLATRARKRTEIAHLFLLPWKSPDENAYARMRSRANQKREIDGFSWLTFCLSEKACMLIKRCSAHSGQRVGLAAAVPSPRCCCPILAVACARFRAMKRRAENEG